MKNNYIIALDSLASGITTYNWLVKKDFFEMFENTDISDSDLKVDVKIEKSGDYLGLYINTDGFIVSSCDRCLDDLRLDIENAIFFRIKFGEKENIEENMLSFSEEGETEVIYLDIDNTEIDLSQIIYDYICTSLPIQNVHSAGECNEETLKYLCKEDNLIENTSSGNTPFADLQGILNKK